MVFELVKAVHKYGRCNNITNFNYKTVIECVKQKLRNGSVIANWGREPGLGNANKLNFLYL